MRENIELTPAKSMLLGVFISLVLLPMFVTPVRASNMDPWWYAGGVWDSAINWNYETRGIRAKIQDNPGWVYMGHVNGYVAIEFPTTPGGRNFIEIGWVKDAIYLGAIKWYMAWERDGAFTREDRDTIAYGSWHYYKIANPYVNWYAYFDEEAKRVFPWPFEGGFIWALGEAAGPLAVNELDSYFKYVKYFYNDVWAYWDAIDPIEYPPYYVDITNPYTFRAYGPA